MLEHLIQLRTNALSWLVIIGFVINGLGLASIKSWWGGRTSVGLGTTARRQRAWLTKVIMFALADIDVAVALLSKNGQLMAPWSRLLILVLGAGWIGFALLIPIVTRYSRPHFLIAPSLREDRVTSRMANGG